MATVRDLVSDSLRLLGVLSTGEVASASEAEDARSALKHLVESWSTEKMFLPSQVIETFPLVAGKKIYTMGVGGDFDTVRPIEIEKVHIKESGSNPDFDLPVRILTDEQYADVRIKDTVSTIPTNVFPQMTTPLVSLYFYPVPQNTKNIVIRSQKLLATIETLNETLELPPGYYRALKYNLAMEVAPEYGIEPSMFIVGVAKESRSNIKRQNKKQYLLKADPSFLSRGRGFSYRTGE